MTHIIALKNINIGNHVLIASKVFISNRDHGSYKGKDMDVPDTSSRDRKLVSKSATIGDNVWIGGNIHGQYYEF